VTAEVATDFAGLARADGVSADAVVVGDLGEGWDYAMLNAAFGLAVEGAELIALQKNRFFLLRDAGCRSVPGNGVCAGKRRVERFDGDSSCRRVRRRSLAIR
jgi:hypothetical protein